MRETMLDITWMGWHCGGDQKIENRMAIVLPVVEFPFRLHRHSFWAIFWITHGQQQIDRMAGLACSQKGLRTGVLVEIPICLTFGWIEVFWVVPKTHFPLSDDKVRIVKLWDNTEHAHVWTEELVIGLGEGRTWARRIIASVKERSSGLRRTTGWLSGRKLVGKGGPRATLEKDYQQKGVSFSVENADQSYLSLIVIKPRSRATMTVVSKVLFLWTAVRSQDSKCSSSPQKTLRIEWEIDVRG